MPLTKKQFVAKATDTNDQERTLTAVISTSAIDRDGEVLNPKGVVLKAYMKNPVVLWAHDYYDTPIGKALWIKKNADEIRAKIQFANTEKAKEVYDLYKGGYLKAFSVGFTVLDGHTPTDEEIKERRDLANAQRIFSKWELLEFSAVPVPANPEALVQALKTKAVKVAEIRDDFEGLDLNEPEGEMDTKGYETFYPDLDEEAEGHQAATVEVVENQIEVKVVAQEMEVKTVMPVTPAGCDIGKVVKQMKKGIVFA